MSDFAATSISPPKDWQAFERKSRLLFELSLRDPHTQNNGRTGQPQHGVDIFGRRGGAVGPYVGVQCKGKDRDYGKPVTERELRDEVKKSEDFRPPLREFILATTAPDDAKIQETARLLEREVRSGGRDLSISVWGWGRLQQEISRYGEAIREFHPDASPFTDQILQVASDVAKNVRELGDAQALATAANQQEILQAIATFRVEVALERPTASAAGVEKHLNDEIDGYRDLIRQNKPRTAIELLTKLRDRVWGSASVRVRFRIASNLGAAHHNISDYVPAASYLMEAADLDPEDPVGKANKIAALLLRGQRDEAHALAVASLNQHPEDVPIALQRLLAVSSGETVEDVWDGLPLSVRTAPELYINRIVSLREAGDDAWYHAATEGEAAHPSDWRLQTMHAEAVLERLLNDDAMALGGVGPNVPTQAELERASDVLASSWKRTLNPEIKPQGAFAHNAALAKLILGQPDTAALLLEEAETHGYTSDETKFMRISIYRKLRRIDDAIRIADTMDDTPRNQIVQADLRIKTAPEEARRILDRRATFDGPREIVGAALTVIDTFCEQNDFAHALEEAERLDSRLPEEPHAPLAIFGIKQESGDPEAGLALDDALARVNDRTDMPTRFLVCNALASMGRYKEITELLEPVTSPKFNSPALRLLVSATVNADRRTALRKLLDQVPREVLDLPFYRRIRISHALATGELASAEGQLRELLQIQPRELELQLHLMNVLFRQNKEAELTSEAGRAAAEFKGSAEAFMTLAQFKKDFVDWREAHDLAYRTLLANHDNESVNRAYAAIFLFEKHPTPIDVAPTVVARNMAIGVKREGGDIVTYIIEPDPTLRRSNTYLSVEHALARSLDGKAVGEQLELPDGSKGKIVWIKPKEVYALHDVLEEFNNAFPDAEGLEKVRVDASSREGLQPVLERVRERHDAIASVASKYASSMLPLTFVARMLGNDPVSTALGLANSGHRLRVCEGTEFERRKALRAIGANNRQGCIVDDLTLHFIRRLRLERAVENVCGPIGLVERAAARIRRKIHELQEGIDKPSMSLFYRDGQYFREEVSSEQKIAILEVHRADQTWIGDHAQIIPAEGTKDPGAEGTLLEALGSSFFDEVRAASGSGRILLSEDLPMRALAEAEYGVQGCWLQVVLMAAADLGHITFREYADAIIELIDANEEFISVSSDLLAYLLKGESGHRLPEAFRKATGCLGGKKADLRSHVAVALGVVRQSWFDMSLSHIVRQAVIGSLLENLIRDRSLQEVEVVLQAFDEFAQLALKDNAVRRYLRDWRRGHFF
jgi:tetratricopeptide (TPR) repeat protein